MNIKNTAYRLYRLHIISEVDYYNVVGWDSIKAQDRIEFEKEIGVK